jgi:hypothetical protein
MVAIEWGIADSGQPNACRFMGSRPRSNVDMCKGLFHPAVRIAGSQARRFLRHQARKPPHAAIRPGRPAPIVGAGTAAGGSWAIVLRVKVKSSNVNVLPIPKLLVKTALVMPKSEILRKIFGGRPVPAPTKNSDDEELKAAVEDRPALSMQCGGGCLCRRRQKPAFYRTWLRACFWPVGH